MRIISSRTEHPASFRFYASLTARFSRPALALITALTIASATPTVDAQDLPDVAQGFQPYVGYQGGQLDKVSTVNGGLTVSIPLVSYPQKGSLALSYSVIFNSFGFQDLDICIAADQPPGFGAQPIPLRNGCTDNIQLLPTGVPGYTPPGPRVVMDQSLYAGGEIVAQDDQNSQPLLDGLFFVITPDNAQHPLATTGNVFRSVDDAGYLFVPSSAPTLGTNLGGPRNAYGGDTAYIMGVAAGTITDSRGNVYTPTGITDTDGNTITFGGSGTVDSTGRVIPPVGAGDISKCPLLPGAQFQPVVSASLWTPPGLGPNGTQPFLFCYANVLISTHFIPGSVRGADRNGSNDYYRMMTMLQSIVLPNGTYWGFLYDASNPSVQPSTTGAVDGGIVGNFGELTTLIYPTGGSVSYTYNLGNGFCNAFRPTGLNPAGAAIEPYIPQVATRTMSDAQGNVLGTWTYNAPPGETGITSILSPTGDLTVPSFVSTPGCGYIDGGEQVYQGGSTSGRLLRSTVKTYAQPQIGIEGITAQAYAFAARLTNEVTTWANGSSSSVQTSYAPGTPFYELVCNSGGSNCGQGSSSLFPIGGPVSETYTDYRGAVLKQENTTYEWQTNSAYLAANLLNIPASTSVLNSASSQVSGETYRYDESAYSPGGIRGHNTTTIGWLNTSAITPTTHTGWNSTGIALGMKSYVVDADANAGVISHINPSTGHTIDYGYNPSTSCNGSEVTSTTNVLNEQTIGTYYCNTGQLQALQDPNLNTTTVYWDVMSRLQKVIYPPIAAGTPITTFCYNDGQNFCNLGAENAVTRTILGNPDPTQTTTAVFDSFGRESHRYTTASPQQISVDTTYDPDGRVSTVTNPYYTTSDPTYGVTQYAYDALNRKVVELDSDGQSIQQWCYNGVPGVDPSSNSISITSQSNCTTNGSFYPADTWVDYADENGHDWQRVSDSLGRLAAVMEPGALQTNYSYDPLGNLLQVNQLGTSSETPRVRTFTYDSLSRLLCAANPENSQNACPSSALTTLPSGVLSYAYDPNGNVLTKTDARGISTDLTYDGLNRISTKTYSDGATPSVRYTYGTNGTTIPNGVGRLISEIVESGSSITSERNPSSYDALGHLLQLNECTPANCNGSFYEPMYGYDLGGNVISSTNGIPTSSFNGATIPSVEFSMGYDVAGRLLSETSSWSDALAHPGTPFQAAGSGIAYTAVGQLENAILGLNSQTGQNLANLVRTFDNRLRPLSEIDTAKSVLQSPPTESYGNISISGTEGQSGTNASGTITISGGDGSHQVCTHRAGNPPVTVCNTLPDTGSLIVTVVGPNGNFTATAQYGGNDNDVTVAGSLATALSASGSPVTGNSNNTNIVTITSIATGPSADYPYSISNGPDFVGADSGATLAGGTVAADTGSITITVNGTPFSATWGTTDNPESIAKSLMNSLAQSPAAGLLTAFASEGTITLNSKQTGSSVNWSLSCSAADTAGQSASFSVACNGMSGGMNSGTGSAIAYQYNIPQTNGYYPNGNLESVTDSVTGGWTYSYDNLNRLTQALGNSGSYAGGFPVSGITLGWSYDSFGNRLGQTSNNGNILSFWACYLPSSVAACNTPLVQPNPGKNNQMSSSSVAMGGLTYDNAGDVTNDGVNQYAYDAEGRICAVYNGLGYTGYLYDGDGHRVAKGTISGLNCNYPSNGFQLTASYVNGTGGEQLTEMTGSGAWDHSNVFAGGALLATYSASDTYFAFNDWLGTKRAALRVSDGCLQTYASLPFGDKMTPAGNCSDATEQHFTAQQRDQESGNDYFQARYYGSTMARFISPDPSGIAFAIPANPQSLNLYGYVQNAPLTLTDPSGLQTQHLGADGGTCIINQGTYGGYSCVPDSSGSSAPATDSSGGPGMGGDGGGGTGPDDGSRSQHAEQLYQFRDPQNETWLTYPPWSARDDVIAIVSQKNNCSAWLNQGTGGNAAQIITNVPILNYIDDPAIGGKTLSGNPMSPISINSKGPFYGSNHDAPPVGGYQAGTFGARMFIFLHELAHKVLAPGFDNNWLSENEKMNNDLVHKYCGAVIDSYHREWF